MTKQYHKGGRGQKAPYASVVIRVPLPLADKVRDMINDYREEICNGITNDSENHSTRNDSIISNPPNLKEAIQIAQGIKGQKKSASVSLAKLINKLYNTNKVTEKLLSKKSDI